ncbi:hypothetical protein BABINDRAFT_162396 [Babjeviella inositovora NRRL Y-12698]|uniref:Ubiquitin carboxyl-terminal hydrolase n=1 Tax=Babjeviella inositovora NRRL Y-12698 TaxID=984486 RepID=A0A1E3QLX8_9ASCO|nr:uncharacterized protein BABINDRAFT_162396 [Babjeviella inositovora NRRL Y-12698]ODQ78695.1 hypothetical protein BABINDRAFT_162396 [Babjeviella inositovora NRRL Y-12698]
MTCLHTAQPPLPSATVYKDDCMYCFDTPESSSGLDICLTCFQAFSRGDLNHTVEHFAASNHKLFLNLKKTPKPEPPRPTKIAKLEVRELSDDELFDTATYFYCAACDSAVDAGAEGAAAAAGVMSATLNAKKEEIKTWEQEILPCEHSLYLDQQEHTGPVPLSQCALCDLRENLWLCLHCGAMGCGRAQFGGISGNSHALSHFEATGHPVAVKLGSLSLDSADCFCYQCSDEVQVPELTKFLGNYGIDVSSHTKTEKNLIELQLDQNMQWEFSLETANGKLEPVFGPHLTGVKNLGNSCYLNSVMQILMQLETYKRFFEAQSFGDKDPSSLHVQLLKLYEGLASGRYSKPAPDSAYQSGIKPSGFKTVIAGTHAEFSSARQQDAYEFWLYAVEKLDAYFLDIVAPLENPNVAMKFVMRNKLVCTSCHGASFSDELVDSLSVPIPDRVINVDADGKKEYERVSLIDSLASYTLVEEISNFTCSNCSQTTTARKSNGFVSFPEVLVVSAQRIKLENWVPVKVDVPIALPHELLLDRFRSTGLAAGEVLVETPVQGFEPNQDALNSLVSMGFPENRCLKGLANTGNALTEEAMNWLFAHMDDADIDAPFVVPAAPAGPAGPVLADIESLVSMGFSPQLANKALVLSGNDVNSAVEWLFANPDDSGEITQQDMPRLPQADVDRMVMENILASPLCVNESAYELFGVVCHKGSSVHTGHYVVFIKQDVDGAARWVLFNDEKVVAVVEESEESFQEMEKNGYLFVFKKRDW